MIGVGDRLVWELCSAAAAVAMTTGLDWYWCVVADGVDTVIQKLPWLRLESNQQI